MKEITDMNVDFAKWYTDVVRKSGLADYSPIKGCMYIGPYGTALWENIRNELDSRFKALGHENVMLPLLISESMLQKEKDHIAGFAPEVAWVTHGGEEKLTERLCIRPTSEVLFCDFFQKQIQSWRDLPLKYNQWCNIVRWEKATRPFLRTTEFFWQEGHTLHETEEEARAHTIRMWENYADFAKNVLAMPVAVGRKTNLEKFAGAVETYTIEPLMHDGQALQAGTSHYLGTGFAKAYGITFADRSGKIAHPHQTSWGVSTRLIGGIIMSHGDNNGLVLPPRIAPVQVVVIPVQMQKDGVLKATEKLAKSIEKIARVKVDKGDQTPGWKFSEWEMKGVPLRIEYGPRDIENKTCVIARRDTGEKQTLLVADLKKQISLILDQIQNGIYEKALKRNEGMLHEAKTFDEMKELAKTKKGFIKAPWCGSDACEQRIKKEIGLTSRCIPSETFGQKIEVNSICCSSAAKHIVLWGRAY